MRFRDTLVPAYGRDYTSRASVMADLQAGKDFRIAVSGQLINAEQLRQSGATSVAIRYKRSTECRQFDIA